MSIVLSLHAYFYVSFYTRVHLIRVCAKSLLRKRFSIHRGVDQLAVVGVRSLCCNLFHRSNLLPECQHLGTSPPIRSYNIRSIYFTFILSSLPPSTCYAIVLVLRLVLQSTIICKSICYYFFLPFVFFPFTFVWLLHKITRQKPQNTR